MIEVDYLDEEAGGGKEQSLIATAEAYLRGYARHPADRATELMPRDAAWTKATRRLYSKLTPQEQTVIDSYAWDDTDIDHRKRRLALKRLAQKLIIEAGYQSSYNMILLPQKGGI